MKKSPRQAAAYTLVELLIGVSLALTVMMSVLSTYLFLGRQLARLAHRQTLETEARRAILSFAQDMRGAVAVSNPGDTSVILTVPTASSTMTVTYTYASGSDNTGTLTRTPSVGSAQVLLRYLSAFDFNYYDSADAAVTDFTNKVSSIKKVSFTFSSRTGTRAASGALISDGAQTPVYQGASPRFNLGNTSLLN